LIFSVFCRFELHFPLALSFLVNPRSGYFLRIKKCDGYRGFKGHVFRDLDGALTNFMEAYPRDVLTSKYSFCRSISHPLHVGDRRMEEMKIVADSPELVGAGAAEGPVRRRRNSGPVRRRRSGRAVAVQRRLLNNGLRSRCGCFFNKNRRFGFISAA